MAGKKKRAPTKRYKGFLAKPRKLTRAEVKRDSGLPTSPEEKLAAEHDTHGHWGLLYEELCTEYSLDHTAASMKFLWMRMAKRHVPAARDLALPGKAGRSPEENADLIDAMLRGLGVKARHDVSQQIARLLLTRDDGLVRIRPQAIRNKALQIVKNHLQREARRRP